jgi:hypothetical protein
MLNNKLIKLSMLMVLIISIFSVNSSAFAAAKGTHHNSSFHLTGSHTSHISTVSHHNTYTYHATKTISYNHHRTSTHHTTTHKSYTHHSSITHHRTVSAYRFTTHHISNFSTSHHRTKL